MWLHKLRKFITSLFYPSRCPYCGTFLKSGKTLCGSCEKEIKSEPIVRELELFDDITLRAVSAFSYDGKVKDAICDFKFKNKLDYVEHFSRSIVNVLEKVNIDKNFDYICCVPMSKDHEKERGYNQAKVLAKSVSNILKIPFKDVLVKVKKTKTQHTLARDERLINVKGAYIALNKEYVQKKKILLCDDILTTGSTVKECALALYNAGASDVLAICIANRD